MKKTVKAFGELALIARIRDRSRAAAGSPVRLGIGDDCAVLRPPRGCDVLVTTDFTLEGRHFRRDWHTPESVGHRCLARGLSDLAAMGAEPMAAFLSLGLPATFVLSAAGRKWVDSFLSGLLRLAERFEVTLAGGDTAQAPGEEILADIVLVGTAPRGKEMRRSGARAGDRLFCTGALGGAAAELDLLRQGKRQRSKDALHPQLFPEPRVAVGRALLRRGLASACMDVSDGISTDLGHLCRESGVGAVVMQEAVPVHALAAATGADEGLRLALHGGEDYELLFTARPVVRMPRSIAGVKISEIGRIVAANEGVRIQSAAGGQRPLTAAGWEHFKN